MMRAGSINSDFVNFHSVALRSLNSALLHVVLDLPA